MTSFKPNPLSALGRIGYGAHYLFYPIAGAVYYFVIAPEMKRRNQAADQKEWESMPKANKVDPDLFNPFTPVPYHNNPELKYAFAHINMHNYLNANHINAKDYVWKSYHNSFDHNNRNAYMYNWTSVHSPIDKHDSHSHGHH